MRMKNIWSLFLSKGWDTGATNQIKKYLKRNTGLIEFPNLENSQFWRNTGRKFKRTYPKSWSEVVSRKNPTETTFQRALVNYEWVNGISLKLYDALGNKNLFNINTWDIEIPSVPPLINKKKVYARRNSIDMIGCKDDDSKKIFITELKYVRPKSYKNKSESPTKALLEVLYHSVRVFEHRNYLAEYKAYHKSNLSDVNYWQKLLNSHSLPNVIVAANYHYWKTWASSEKEEIKRFFTLYENVLSAIKPSKIYVVVIDDNEILMKKRRVKGETKYFPIYEKPPRWRIVTSFDEI